MPNSGLARKVCWPEKSAPEDREEAAAGVPWSGHGFGLEHERIAERVQAPDEPPDLHINQEVDPSLCHLPLAQAAD
jgi:hypothetical protein